MTRRTPLTAVVLAPVVPLVVALLQQFALGPLVRLVWTGTAQPVPSDVFDTLNAVIVRRDRAHLREPLASAFAQMAAARPLRATTLDLLAVALGGDRSETVRSRAIVAPAYFATTYAPAEALIAAAL